MLLEIKDAKHLKNYSIKLKFNTGEEKIVDLEKSLHGKIFEPLKDIKYFKSFKINFNTIEWENGADFAPEFLYKLNNEA